MIFTVTDPAVTILLLAPFARVGAGRQYEVVNVSAPQLVLRASGTDLLDDVTFARTSIGSITIPQGSVATVSYGDANITVHSQVGVGTRPNELVQIDASGRLPPLDASQLINLPVIAAYRNRFRNGDFAIDQRNDGAAVTITADAGPHQYAMKISGAQRISTLLFGQRIAVERCFDLAGSTATVSTHLSGSGLVYQAWTAYYANSPDNFAAKTSFASGSVGIGTARATQVFTINVPPQGANGICIEWSLGAAGVGPWTILW